MLTLIRLQPRQQIIKVLVQGLCNLSNFLEAGLQPSVFPVKSALWMILAWNGEIENCENPRGDS